jgi:hypothetical protein
MFFNSTTNEISCATTIVNQVTNGTDSVAIGIDAGLTNQGTAAVAIGKNAGKQSQRFSSVAIGNEAGNTSQQDTCVAIGYQAGSYLQSIDSVAIGSGCGQSNQGTCAVAIGYQSGLISQAANCVAVGRRAGQTGQLESCIAIGAFAGQSNQQEYSVALGYSAGTLSQGVNSIAIGKNAGKNYQGSEAIAIGTLAGNVTQPANTIVLNATGAVFSTQPADASAFYVNPVRAVAATSTILYYNDTTKEITYATSSAATKNSILPLQEDTSVLFGLQPKTYVYNSDPASGRHIGYIAEEAAAIHEKFAGYNEPGGAPVGIDYFNIVVFLVEELRKLREKSASLEEDVLALKKAVAALSFTPSS